MRLLPGYRPRGKLERRLAAALSDGPLPLDTLVDRVVERLVRAEAARGGWVSDVGIWGPQAFGQRVVRAIKGLDGSMLVVESGTSQAGQSPANPDAGEPNGGQNP